jgi:hypothetical protein
VAKGVARKKGKANRKHGRNKVWCSAYRHSGQQEINKLIRQARHLKRYGPKAETGSG